MFWKILDFVRIFADDKHFEKVLDVGSRNINGSVKDVLQGKYDEFIGIDFIEGKDVDIVMNAHDLRKKFKRNYFDLITCCETLEHDDRFWKTVNIMKERVKSGGWLLISTPGINFFKHDFPSDYWRFTEEAYTDFFFKGWKNVHVENYTDSHSEYVNKPNNVMGYAQKP